MPEVEALADCLKVVVDETLSALPEDTREGTRLAMALFVRTDLGHFEPAAHQIIARVFSVPVEAISPAADRGAEPEPSSARPRMSGC